MSKEQALGFTAIALLGKGQRKEAQAIHERARREGFTGSADELWQALTARLKELDDA